VHECYFSTFLNHNHSSVAEGSSRPPEDQEITGSNLACVVVYTICKYMCNAVVHHLICRVVMCSLVFKNLKKYFENIPFKKGMRLTLQM
jgi:hypothetical protein